MNNWKEELKIRWAYYPEDVSAYELCLSRRDVEIFVCRQVQHTLEQIENTSNDKLLDLIEKLKQEYQ